MHRLDIGVGEHEMIEEVWKGETSNGDAEVVHVGKVRLPHATWPMHLLKDDLTGWSMGGPPDGHMPLERAQLDQLVAARVEPTQLVEERFDLAGGIPSEVIQHPGPIVGKRIGTGSPTWLFELTGELREPFIFAERADAHARAGRRLFLGFTFASFVAHAVYLVVGFHGALLPGLHGTG